MENGFLCFQLLPSAPASCPCPCRSSVGGLWLPYLVWSSGFWSGDVVLQQLLHSCSRADHCELLCTIITAEYSDNLGLLVVYRTARVTIMSIDFSQAVFLPFHYVRTVKHAFSDHLVSVWSCDYEKLLIFGNDTLERGNFDASLRLTNLQQRQIGILIRLNHCSAAAFDINLDCQFIFRRKSQLHFF